MGKARINNTKLSPLPSHLSHPILSFPAFSSRNLTAAFSRKRYICAISKLWLIGGASATQGAKKGWSAPASLPHPASPTLRSTTRIPLHATGNAWWMETRWILMGQVSVCADARKKIKAEFTLDDTVENESAVHAHAERPRS